MIRQDLIVRGRNERFDVMKGIGITLMIIGHCPLPWYFSNTIFTFHMPLFFMLSGYLYKERALKDIVKRNAKKVLIPYFIIGIIVWGFLLVSKGDYKWGYTLLTSNGSWPIYHQTKCGVGPLWFLMCYFVAMIYFHYFLKIKNEPLRISTLIVLFALAMLYRKHFNLLPFDMLNAIPAIAFMYMGYAIKDHSVNKVFFSKPAQIAGLTVVLLCIYRGGVSMASMIYKLWYLQFFAALYSCYFLYKYFTSSKWHLYTQIFSFIGRNSLTLLCVHSIDYLTECTALMVEQSGTDGVYAMILEIVLKLSFVAIGYVLIKGIQAIRPAVTRTNGLN